MYISKNALINIYIYLLKFCLNCVALTEAVVNLDPDPAPAPPPPAGTDTVSIHPAKIEI